MFSITAPVVVSGGDGAHERWSIHVDEAQAFAAVFSGGMWLPNPTGGRIYAKYQRHILHDDGTWTWIGRVETVHGPQSVVLTFGKGVMFGYIPTASGWPLTISTAHGQTRITATSGKLLARSTEWLRLHSQSDAVIPPRLDRTHAVMAKVRPAIAAATAAAPVTIDLMVAYTPGFVKVYGSTGAALARIRYLVDWANQAYINSHVYQRLRLVHTVEVNYTDSTSDTSALHDLSGYNDSGAMPIPAPLQGIAGLRSQYGADLVSLVRPLDAGTEAARECGASWLDGEGGAQPVATWGYSAISDIHDSTVTDGVNCLDLTLAHELGHNMGNDHDRATAQGTGQGGTPSGGAYPYSYGYENASQHFATIMAYPGRGEPQLQVFSNPDISICDNDPCGVADSAADSADNAHSMNNTAPIVAQFEPTMVGPVHGAHNDVNGDGQSDILFTNPATGQFVYWLMHGSVFGSWAGFSAGASWRVIGTGDFDGDGRTDLLWQGAGSVHVWLANRDGGFVDRRIAAAPPAGWQLIGTGDIDGNGDDDLFWYNAGTHQLVSWYVNQGAYTGFGSAEVPSGYVPGGVGYLMGDGHADVVWTDAANNLHAWIPDAAGAFEDDPSNGYIGPGWVIAGVGDIDGNGKDDVVWMQPTTGALEYFLMDGATVTAYRKFGAGSAYAVVAVGDFDGDGRSDILWRSTTGNLVMWLHASQYTFRAEPARAAPTGWNILH